MKITRAALLVLPAVLLFAACGDAAGPEPGPVAIRVENGSAITFDEVTVWFPASTERFGALSAGGTSRYRIIDRAYRYAGVEIRIGTETRVLMPIDYFGEDFLREGRYTYILGLEEGAVYPTLLLRQEK